MNAKYYVCKKIRMMKRIAIACCCLMVVSLQSIAQHRPPRVSTYSDEDVDEGKGFKKDHIFIGGSLNLGFSSYVFNVGGAPEIGYSFNKWIDAGVLINVNYTSERADPYYNDDTRTRVFNYGAGAFAKFYPLPFLFVIAEPEYNWVTYSAKYIPTGESSSYQTQAPSLLLGIGYGQRFIGHSSYYIAIMFDAASNPNSPYRDYYNNTAIPVIKAGFDFYLHSKRRGY
jgi:hypothetical protein